MMRLWFLAQLPGQRPSGDYREVLRIIDCIPASGGSRHNRIEEQIKQEGRLLGRQEGLEAGRVEALRDVLRMLLEQRFGPVGADHETLIAAGGLDELQRAVARVAVASDLASVFQPH
ncbi:MAG: hypothetical protein IPH72_23930 [Sandaracinaceae bacterium]|nr:hypothetical protein [Sandaracinaceae bacterium]